MRSGRLNVIDFDSLRSFEDWSGALDRLLAEAERVIREGDNNERVKVQQELRAFRRKSPPTTALTRLDAVAREAVRDIAIQSVDEALIAIADRSNELDDLILELRSAAGAANRSASLINLESPTAIATSLTETIGAFKNLREEFADAENAEDVAKRLETAINAITKLRDEIEDAT